MRSVLIRRFELSDQLTHLFNALLWAVLAATGILIGSASRANLEPTHLSIGVHFAFGFALAVLLSAYILFAKSRFQRMLFEIFRTDRPFLAWLKCLGGYPSKILNRPQKPGSVPPQGRYNAGQRIAYGALIFLNIFCSLPALLCSHCTNRRRYRAVLTDWRYASIPALSVLPVCCLQHTFRWRFCQDSHLKPC